jgi:hypothetical protein
MISDLAASRTGLSTDLSRLSALATRNFGFAGARDGCWILKHPRLWNRGCRFRGFKAPGRHFQTDRKLDRVRFGGAAPEVQGVFLFMRQQNTDSDAFHADVTR